MDKGKYLRTHQNVHKTSEKNSFFQCPGFLRDVCVSCGSLTHRLCDIHGYPVYQALLNKPLAFFSLFSRIHHQVRYVLSINLCVQHLLNNPFYN